METQVADNGSRIPALIKQFVANNYLLGDPGQPLKDEQSFLDSGIIDSTGILELVAFVEEKFDIKVNDEELIPENLDSVTNLHRFIVRKQDAHP